MKKINRKGFTLIELLAVIVILAVIMVVTIPSVLTAMSGAKVSQLNNASEAVARWLTKNYELANLDLDLEMPSVDPAYTNFVNKMGTFTSSYGDASFSSKNLSSCGNSNATYCKEESIAMLEAAGVSDPENNIDLSNSYVLFSDNRFAVKLNAKEGGVFYTNDESSSSNFTSRLPDGYQEVEYIEGTGTQFINTEVLGNNNNLSFDIQYSWTELPSSGTYKYVFGAYSSENDNATRILQYGSSTTYFNTNSKAGGGSGSMSLNRSINIIYHDTLSANINSEFTYSSNGNTQTKTFVQGNNVVNNIYIFGNTSSLGSTKSKIKLYNFKIYDNGVLIRLIRNFIPAYRKSDEEVGLYDTVNDVFYQNAGTGDFIAGPDVTNS